MSHNRAFTLIEMLIATVLAAILMGGLLVMSAGLARDQRRMSAQSNVRVDGIVELFRFDLANARSIAQATDGQTIMLIGHGGLDRRTLTPTNRLSRVIYRIDAESGGLTRTQEYVDDSARPDRWSALVAGEAARLEIASVSGDGATLTEPLIGAAFAPRRVGDVRLAAQVPIATGVPSRVRLRIASQSSPVDQEIWTR